jgi:phenylalanyl-tRNA synthetase beta chain
MIGQGFLEVRTISLSNEEVQFVLMEREETDHLRLTNPISIEHTMIRSSVIPTLLSLLRSNKHRDLPQRLFENADIMVGDRSRNMFCALSEDNRSSFTEAKGYLQRLLGDLGIEFILQPIDLGWYIKGRGAAVMVELDHNDQNREFNPFPEIEGGKMIPLGHFGEIHPRLISENELRAPVSAIELDLDLIVEMTSL